MSQAEKENLIELISTLVVTTPYLLFIFNRYASESLATSDEVKFWAGAILLIIPIRIVVLIIVHIVFAIGKAIITGKSDEKEIVDERDKLIDLKGNRYISDLFFFGLLLATIVAAITGSIGLFFAITFVSAFIGEIFGLVAKIFYYRKGL